MSLIKLLGSLIPVGLERVNQKVGSEGVTEAVKVDTVTEKFF